LKGFKTSPEHTIATAMGNITIDEDDLSDEYDFMDEDDETGERRRQQKEQQRSPQYKYKQLLQELANRSIDEITIDLDEVAAVCLPILGAKDLKLTPSQWEKDNDESLRLVDSIELNTKHYVDIMSKAVDEVMPPPTADVRCVYKYLKKKRTMLTTT
jgi:DNA replication licensing factor MCM7